MVAGDFISHRQCQTCLAIFPSHDELYSHLEIFRVGERTLALELEKCRAHTAQVYDPNKLCEGCQLNASLLLPPSNPNNEHEERNADAQSATGPHTESFRPNTPFRKCPFRGCEKQFKVKKALLKHFELHVDCNEVCVECFRRFTHVSALMKHVKTHIYSSDRKQNFMLGLCDDLRDKAISELNRMVETLQDSTVDANLTTAKRNLRLLERCEEQNSPKRVKPGESERGVFHANSDQPPQAQLRCPSLPPECFGLPQEFGEDMFAPLLFHDYPKSLLNNFDPPFFLGTSSLHHGTRSGRDDIGRHTDIADPVFDSGSQLAREDGSVGMGGPSLDYLSANDEHH